MDVLEGCEELLLIGGAWGVAAAWGNVGNCCCLGECGECVLLIGGKKKGGGGAGK